MREKVTGRCMDPRWADGFGECIADNIGNILDLRLYGEYSEPIRVICGAASLLLSLLIACPGAAFTAFANVLYSR
jgi:hypothetical protein